MKKVFLALFVMLMMVSCNKFKINVNLENSDGKTVYLERYVGTEMSILDSVVAKDNTAVFKVKPSDNLDPYCVMIKGWRRPLTFFADNQDVTITGDYQKYNGINVLASESQEKLNKFTEEVNGIEDEQEIHYCVLDFVKQNIDNPLAPYVMYRYKWTFSLSDFYKLMEVIPAEMNSAYKDLVMDYVNGLEMTEVGKPFIPFIQKDVNGEDFNMKEIIGESKIIILDFWASWCPDCRKENPGLVEIYNEFKDKGLDIVSVSLDMDEAAWKKAIEDDNLTWKHHVSDLKGWNNEVAKMYCIAYIPQNILIDENGIIVKKNVPAERMKEFLGSFLK
ncbi:MAG: AhpC/TSA family protein [Bacteroidales bacterium]|jgi:peroxiredoxin|nr:AhpC/TSA family protein [Bacteroidales bacterium]